jgi:hypothetical protein
MGSSNSSSQPGQKIFSSATFDNMRVVGSTVSFFFSVIAFSFAFPFLSEVEEAVRAFCMEMLL